MTELSTHTRTELAHRSSAGMDVTLIWMRRATARTRSSSASATGGRARTSRSRPSRTSPSTSTTTRSPTGTSAPSTTKTVAWRRSPMVQVGTYPTRSDAELAQTALAAAGIASVVASDDAGGAYPFDLTGGARLLVDETDAEDAAAMLSDRPTRTSERSDDDDHHRPPQRLPRRSAATRQAASSGRRWASLR